MVLIEAEILPITTSQTTPSIHLPVATERKGVVALPDVTTTRTSLVETVTLAPETTVLPSSRSKTTDLTVLHDRITDPVDLRITTDGRMRRIYHDNFKELEGTILSDRIRVENTKVHATGSSTHLSNGTKVVRAGHAEDPFVTGLTPDNSTMCRTSTTTTTYADTIDNITLLGLVTEHTCLVRTSRTSSTVNSR